MGVGAVAEQTRPPPPPPPLDWSPKLKFENAIGNAIISCVPHSHAPTLFSAMKVSMAVRSSGERPAPGVGAGAGAAPEAAAGMTMN